jgi:hypothetical protein
MLCRSSGTISRLVISAHRAASAISIVRRRFQRSTNTPASGPTTRTGAAVAMRAPLAAAGAQVWPLAMTVAIQSNTVIVKTMSPVAETDWPSQSSRQFLLRQRPDCERARIAANPGRTVADSRFSLLSQKSYIRLDD